MTSMKTKIYSLAFALLALCAGCDDFLDTESLEKKTTDIFPKTQTDAEQMITGIYSSLLYVYTEPEQAPFFIFELAGDDRVGGGSTSNKGAQSLDRLYNNGTSWMTQLWLSYYSGIYRANTAITTMDNVTEWSDPNAKNEYLAEAYFLRAHFYYELALVFGQVPLVTTTMAVNLPKASADEIYAQIADDLVQAIKLFPNKKYGQVAEGHVSKWAAEALLARVFLFYTGYYKKTELPTLSANVTKADIQKYLEDCINNSGHGLLPDQRSLWPYTNKYTAATYQYCIDNNTPEWVGEKGSTGNEEYLFVVKFSNTSGYYTNYYSQNGSKNFYANRMQEFFGPRKVTGNTYPFMAQGYTNGMVCSSLWYDWLNDPDYAGDYRREGSICNKDTELPNHKGDPNKEVEDTRFIAKKMIGIYANVDGSDVNYSFMYGGQNDSQLGNNQDVIVIRFADVLLMHSEITGTADGMNKVRARAGLPAITYSLEALKKERRFELCFEALRWNDLRRWGDVEEIVKNQTGIYIKNRNIDAKYEFHPNGGFMERYKATGGFFKIPESQVTLSNGVLEQNPGWEDKWNWLKLPYSTL